MRVAELIIASCILAISGVGVASAQFVDPLRVLEESRRDRLEMDKRLAREAAARRQKEKADQATQAAAQRKLERDKAALASGAPTPTTPLGASSASAASTTLVSNPPAASPSHEIAGTPIPIASPANTAAASATLASAQPGALSARDVAPNTPVQATTASAELGSAQLVTLPAREAVAGTARPPGPTLDTPNGMPPPSQSGAPIAQEIASTAPIPTGPGPTAATKTPASNQIAPAPPGDAVLATPVAPPPRVLITVDKAAQRMRVIVDGKLRHFWPVSTGRAHYETPTGTFRPLYLAKVHYSKEWDDAPMPHSIFFTDRGHAIHGSNATRSLGRPASHGCVRLAPSKAAALFALVQAEGQGMTKLIITGGAAVKAMQNSLRSRTGGPRARETAQVQ